jgi:hypothetical protein
VLLQGLVRSLGRDGSVKNETFVDLWIDMHMVLVGHRDSFGLDHVLLPFLVPLVKDEAVALGGKGDEEDSVQKRLEFVAPATDSRPFIWSLLRVNGRSMKINNTVGVAVRSRGLPDLFVQEHTCPPCDACSEVGIDVVSSSPLLLQVLVPALEEISVDLAED